MADCSNETFHVGDRVILHGLRNAARLNGRHGVIASLPSDDEHKNSRYGLDLDLPDPKHPKGLAVKAVNLLREPAIPPDSTARAGTRNGLLVEEHGKAMSFVLDTVRYLVGLMLLEDPDIDVLPDIDRLKDRDMVKINYMTALGWTHWLDPGSFHQNTQGSGVYECLHEYLCKDIVEKSWGSVDNIPPSFKRIYDSIVEPAAVAGWNVRVHGDFWIVSMENDGTYIVPDLNPRAVYQVLGLTQPLGTMIQRRYQGCIVKMRLTMIPWYGRLVYDGVVSPVDCVGELGGPQIANTRRAQRLREAVRLAKEEGRVVARLAQLEVPGGSRVGIDGKDPSLTATQTSSSSSSPPPQEREATPEEQRLVEAFSVIPHVPPSTGSGSWTFRRFAYTEEENPNHIGMIYQAEPTVAMSGVVGPFTCSALEPSSVDILSSLVKYSRSGGFRPRHIAIDDQPCSERVKFLLKDLENAAVTFYMPPTEEETNALNLCNIAGSDPTS